MLQKKTGLILAGLAAYAAYRYSKMSPDQKASLIEKGKKILNQYLPENMKDMFGKGENSEEGNGAFKPGI